VNSTYIKMHGATIIRKHILYYFILTYFGHLAIIRPSSQNLLLLTLF